MAAAVANALAHADGVAICAHSAGLYAVEGDPISQNAILALEKADIEPVSEMDYHMHAAKNLTDEAISGFDLLIPMTRTHAMELILRHPDAVKKIVCMPRQIFDPFGGDLQVYEACLAEIADGVRAILHGEV
jgi:protein-tyrosine-phosphatase